MYRSMLDNICLSVLSSIWNSLTSDERYADGEKTRSWPATTFCDLGERFVKMLQWLQTSVAPNSVDAKESLGVGHNTNTNTY